MSDKCEGWEREYYTALSKYDNLQSKLIQYESFIRSIADNKNWRYTGLNFEMKWVGEFDPQIKAIKLIEKS